MLRVFRHGETAPWEAGAGGMRYKMTCDPLTKSGLRFCRTRPAICLLPPLERGLKPAPPPWGSAASGYGGRMPRRGPGGLGALGLGEPPPTHPQGWLGVGIRSQVSPGRRAAGRGLPAAASQLWMSPRQPCQALPAPGRADSPPFPFPRSGRLGRRAYEGSGAPRLRVPASAARGPCLLCLCC